MKIIKLPADWQGESAYFLEGAILASNVMIKPLPPEEWCESIGVALDEANSLLVPHINQQHNLLLRSEYSLSILSKEEMADLAEGFMTVWPVIEEQYQHVELDDGTMRMLQALLTTFMLAIDEAQTQQNMKQSGIETPPSLDDLFPQLDLMINEVALASNELMLGAKAQIVNPYKHVGRNDACPCGSGRKFKQCCAK